MSHADRPNEYDAVLGSSKNIPQGALVLGGLAGVKQRLSHPVVALRVEAIQEAIKYGQKGIELVIKGLQDDSEQVQLMAYRLLKSRQQSQDQSEINRALRAYLPYRLFTCVKTIKTGNQLALNSTGTAIVHQKGKNIHVMNLDREETLYTIPISGVREIYALCPNADVLVRIKNSIQSNSPEIEVWERGELKHSLYGHQLDITALAIAPDGKVLATGCEDGSIRLWQIATGKMLGNFSTHLIFGSHNRAVSRLAFSADGHTLVSAAQDSTIKLWDLRTRDRPYTLKIFSSYAILSPVGLILAAISWQVKIQLWYLNLEKKTNYALCTLYDRTYLTSTLTFSPYGRILISGARDGKITFWDVYGKSQFHQLSGHEGAIDSLVLSSRGDRLLSTDRSNVVKIWEVR